MGLKEIFEREGLLTYGTQTTLAKSKADPEPEPDEEESDPDMDLNLDDEGDHDEPDGDEDGSKPSDDDGDEPAKPMAKSLAQLDQELLEELLLDDGVPVAYADQIEVSDILSDLTGRFAKSQAKTRHAVNQLNQRLANVADLLQAVALGQSGLVKSLGATFGELDSILTKSNPAPNSGMAFNVVGAAPAYHGTPTPTDAKPIDVTPLAKSKAATAFGAAYAEQAISKDVYSAAAAHIRRGDIEGALALCDADTAAQLREAIA